MDDKLKTALAGRSPLVIGFDDIPSHGDQQFITILVKMVRATVNVEGRGSTEADAFILSRKQAFDLAVRLTEIVGPLDLAP
jgi:hypothetical protein